MTNKKTTLRRILKRTRLHLHKVLRSERTSRIYVVSALLILLATTIFWAALSARVQQSNADQLVNAYLFEDLQTFQGAQWPAQHSFLLKWPLVWLVSLFGASTLAFSIMTVLVVVLTVAGLVAILYWIDRRPLPFGTLCLALSSVLLLVPTLPYASGLLPVNMGMLMTRNIEYIIYIVSLLLLLKAKKVWGWQSWLSLMLLTLLFTSDKLFISISLGGALVLLVSYGIFRRWSYVRMWLRWLAISIVAIVASVGLTLLINASNFTHIVGESSVGPYNFVNNWQNVVLGIIYVILGIFTNLGANPVFDVTIVKNIPSQLWTRLGSINIAGFVTNIAVLVTGLYAILRVVRMSLTRPRQKSKEQKADIPLHISLMLIASSIATIVVFLATNHYYAVDSRYLAISLFAIFVTLAVFSRKRRFEAPRTMLVGFCLVIAIIIGCLAAFSTYNQERHALSPVDKRNELVASALAYHPVKTLVGDYWRVMPIKLTSDHQLDILPLDTCTEPRASLTSTAWQADLKHQSFAYILSFDHSLTDYPQCTLSQIRAHFGHPTSSVLIAGTLDKPTELLLFYDHGTETQPTANHNPAHIGPISLDQLTDTTCESPTTMNVVAHQDDDLLFMNPDLSHAISAGYCIRTIYVTAGDAGGDTFYWLSREQGSQAAYAQMLGIRNEWTQRIVKLNDHEFVAIAKPAANPRISLIFMHLPDGNLNGHGFKASHFESLGRLQEGKIKEVQSTDGQSRYTASQLIDALSQLVQKYQPSEIRTQSPRNMSRLYADHSDHLAVGRFMQAAYEKYEHPHIPIKYYIGYPIREMKQNLSDAEFANKQAIFLTYSKFDGSVCQSPQICDRTPTYHAYLRRQYQLSP